MKQYFRHIILILCLTLFANTQAQKKDQTTRILFVLDASSSMLDIWEKHSKWEIAKDALKKVIDSLKHDYNVEFSLRTYGDQYVVYHQNCEDTRNVEPFGKTNEERIKTKLDQIYPRGITPIAYSLKKCVNDFPNDPNARNIVILLTDGNEVCDGDPCEVSFALQKKKVFLRPFVIAMNVPEEFFYTLECIGVANNVRKEKEFSKLLQNLVTKTIAETSAEIDLLDEQRLPTETGLNITYHNNITDKVEGNMYHTMNARGVPDTIYLESMNTYGITIHSYPPLKVDTFTILPSKHNKIPVMAAHGELIVKVAGMTVSDYQKSGLKYIIRQHDDMDIVHIQDLNVRTKYLTGDYDLEVLTLPRVFIDDVRISQVRTTALEIPAPGIAKIAAANPGYGSIFMIEESGALKKIYDFEQGKPIREVLYLQPGSYQLMYRKGTETRAEKTSEKSFTIESNKTLNINLF